MHGKILRRSMSFLMVLVLLFSAIPWNQAQAAELSFEEKLEWLFYEHPRDVNFGIGTCFAARELYNSALEIIMRQPAIAGYSLKDWVAVIYKGPDTLEKEWSYAAAEGFFLEYASHLDMSGKVEEFSECFNSVDIITSGLLEITDGPSENDLEEIHNAVSSNSEILRKLTEKTLSATEHAIALTNVSVTLFMLYSCELSAMESLLDTLEKAEQTESGLYVGLQRVYENLRNPRQYIITKLAKQMTESFAACIVDNAVSAISKKVFPASSVITCVDTLLWIAKKALKYPEAKDLTKAIHYAEYYETVTGAMLAIQLQMLQNSAKDIKDASLIDNYEILFDACITLLLQCAQEALKMKLKAYEEENLRNGIRICETYCSFENFVMICYRKAVQGIENEDGDGNYRYHIYVNENGKRFVCPYAGTMQYPGTTFTIEYSEWVNEPLDVDNGSYQYYVHTKTAECEKYGCVDPSWEGFRYVDENGKTWVCPEVKNESKCVHLWSGGKIKQNATCEGEGIYLFICSLCGQSREESAPAKGHSFENNICTICKEGRGVIADRLNQLCTKLEGVYFTTTGKSCGNSNCDACAMKNVVKTERMIELFDGFVPAESVAISHDYGKNNPFTNGWSCCGFANFAGWYLFAENTKDSVDFNCICPSGKPVAFTQEGLMAAGVKPGDLLRLSKHPTLGAEGHSAVFVDFTENGILILDCNMRLSGDGYCRVRTHELKYGQIYSYICVSRADNYDQVVDSNPEEDGNFQTQYRYHMYVNAEGKRFVCPYAGQLSYPETTFEIQYTEWLDAPLTVDNGSYPHYVHTKTDKCEEYGCLDASWEGNRYRDSAGLTWVCQEIRKVPAACEHQWNDGEVVLAATCGVSGEKRFACELCGETKTEEIPPLDHNYVDGICQNCGEIAYVIGDADGNGDANYHDALLVLRFSIGLEALSAEAERACDLDGIPGLSYNDALLILRRSIGLS